jgi:hypothetical protein
MVTAWLLTAYPRDMTDRTPGTGDRRPMRYSDRAVIGNNNLEDALCQASAVEFGSVAAGSLLFPTGGAGVEINGMSVWIGHPEHIHPWLLLKGAGFDATVL